MASGPFSRRMRNYYSGSRLAYTRLPGPGSPCTGAGRCLPNSETEGAVLSFESSVSPRPGRAVRAKWKSPVGLAPEGSCLLSLSASAGRVSHRTRLPRRPDACCGSGKDGFSGDTGPPPPPFRRTRDYCFALTRAAGGESFASVEDAGSNGRRRKSLAPGVPPGSALLSRRCFRSAL